ncbi:hypothetical protein [Marinobacter sp. SS21]|uniref:hypothetical protein n=1 Tax=Marinobacter sp. SS21 TaxID=2979460 RepID=UPI00232B3CA6|nr:hypothetical protein [Marinobacter sp. SS21]MDC0661056.1 hypothetical protein [Marinobacter sp. SS21]
MTENTPPHEARSLGMMYGTYADVLFVLFPFLAIVMQRLWDGKLEDVLLRPDLSIAAAILGGLAIGKFVLGLVTERDLGRFKERIVFFIAVTMFVVLGPAIILILSIVGNEDIPGFVAFVQPILLIVSISLYTTAISISNILIQEHAPLQDQPGDAAARAGQESKAEVSPEPLNIPRRHEGDAM